MDGANCFQKIRYIVLPSLRSTIVILLLFALGGIVKGNFGLFYNIVGTNPLLYDTTDIIETYVYRSTMTDFNFSTASAVGLYQSIIGFCIVMAFKDTDTAKTEYVLAGTFLSFGIALLCGLMAA